MTHNDHRNPEVIRHHPMKMKTLNRQASRPQVAQSLKEEADHAHHVAKVAVFRQEAHQVHGHVHVHAVAVQLPIKVDQHEVEAEVVSRL